MAFQPPKSLYRCLKLYFSWTKKETGNVSTDDVLPVDPPVMRLFKKIGHAIGVIDRPIKEDKIEDYLKVVLHGERDLETADRWTHRKLCPYESKEDLERDKETLTSLDDIDFESMIYAPEWHLEFLVHKDGLAELPNHPQFKKIERFMRGDLHIQPYKKKHPSDGLEDILAFYLQEKKVPLVGITFDFFKTPRDKNDNDSMSSVLQLFSNADEDDDKIGVSFQIKAFWTSEQQRDAKSQYDNVMSLHEMKLNDKRVPRGYERVSFCLNQEDMLYCTKLNQFAYLNFLYTLATYKPPSP